MGIYISDIIPIIIAFQSMLFALVLLTDNGPKKISNRYLAAFILVMGVQFTAITSESLGLKVHFLTSVQCVYGFAYGPLLYLYTKSLIYKQFYFHIKQLLHFIPILIFLLFSLPGYALCGTIGPLIYVSLIVYIALAIRAIVNYRKVMTDTQSSMARTDLIWLQWTMILFCISLLLDMVDQFIRSMDLLANVSTIHLSILLLINWMFYKGLKQPEIFLGISESDEQLVQDKLPVADGELPDDSEQADLDRIKAFMETHDVYTRAELNLNELAEYIGMPPRRLSYLINHFLRQNFMGFVNQYRIQKAMDRLSHPKEKGETILEVMYEVGFNSKSSFNTLFKQHTGFTPTEFKKQQLKYKASR